MSHPFFKKFFTDPANLFCIGLAGVMLSLTVSFPPVWNTFIHPWRVELVASVFLSLVLIFSFFRTKNIVTESVIGRSELWFVIAPVLTLIVWSGISSFWSLSPRSAVHHSLIWGLYITFYVCVRQLLEKPGSYAKLLSAFTGPLLFFAILAFAGYLTLIFVGNASYLGIVYSKYGEQINTLFPLLVLGILRKRGKDLVFACLAAVMLWLLIFSSSSRTGLGLFGISLAVTGIAIFSVESLKTFRLKFTIMLAAIILVPAAVTAISYLISDSSNPTVTRFSDREHLTGSDDFRKLMIKLSTDMIVENPVLGIGADNFGFRVNEYRARHAARDPQDVTLAQAETSIPERAHNEYLQIAAELGAVGVLIFVWFLVGIARYSLLAVRNCRKVPWHAFAALLGIGIFFASSLVTSYSFRLVQNGLVFFFVLAVLVRVVSKFEREPAAQRFSILTTRMAYAAALIACISLGLLSGVRVWSVAVTTNANSTADLNDAIPLYSKATSLDPEDPSPHYYLGLRYIEAGEYAKAVPLLKESIRIGKAPSPDYSYLATAQSLAGDNIAAEQTMSEAAVMYPRSTFVLARYAALLKLNGKDAESELQMQRARSINESDANGWLAFITSGSKVASELAFQKPESQTKVMDLKPYESIYAVLAERDIRYPDEREKFPWEKISNREGSR